MSSEPETRAYLEFVGGSAAKFYAAVVEVSDDGTWSVAFNFGRIGFPRDWARKIEGATEAKAQSAFSELVADKQRKGYERRPWPAYLTTPSGERHGEEAEDAPRDRRGIYVAAAPGQIPRDGSPTLAGLALPSGHTLRASSEGGPRGPDPVIWISDSPISNIVEVWSWLARAFAETGVWPLIMDTRLGMERMVDVLMDVPLSTGADPFTLLRRWWHEDVGQDDDEFDAEALAPFGRAFPGLAPRTPGERPSTIEPFVGGLGGSPRPRRCAPAGTRARSDRLDGPGQLRHRADPAVGDPRHLGGPLRRLPGRARVRHLTLIVGRPPADLEAANKIAAEHLAFCPDNIFQGVGTVSEYAPMLVDAHRWDFWWD